MRTVAIISAVLASVGVVHADLEYKDGKYICPKDLSNGAFCAGGSLETDIIIRCSNGVGQPGRCSNNLVGQPPIGLGVPARCWEVRPNSGIAACEKNCIVYGSSGTVDGELTLPYNVCQPLHSALTWPSSTSSTGKPPHTTSKPPHSTKHPHTSSKPPHSTKQPHTSSKPPHSTKQTHTSSKPPHSTKQPHTSSKPPHSTKQPHTSSKPPHSTKHPHTKTKTETKTDHYTKTKTHTSIYTYTKTKHSWYTTSSKPPHSFTKTYYHNTTKTYHSHPTQPSGNYTRIKTTTTTIKHKTTTLTTGPPTAPSPPPNTSVPPTTATDVVGPVVTAGAVPFRAGGASAAMVAGLGILLIWLL